MVDGELIGTSKRPGTLEQANGFVRLPESGLHARRAAGRGGLVLRRSDVPGVEKRVGAGSRTVTGEPLELMLWVSGRRDVARVAVA